MKKFLLTLLAFFIGLTVQSQSKTFLGLTLGKTYTEDEFRSKIEQNTSGEYKVVSWNDTLSVDTELAKSNSPAISASVLPYKPEKGKPSYEYGLSSKKELVFVSISYLEQEGKIYKALADSLSSLYQMEPFNDDELGNGLICYDADGMQIILMEYEDKVYLAYSIVDFILPSSSFKFPHIQDSFFGITLGQKYDFNRVKTAVGIKGDFVRIRRDADGNTVTFSNVSYAGKIWDYGEFFLTNEGQFARFCIYDSLGQSMQEKREAKKTYKDLKALLEKKYDDTVAVEDDRGLEASTQYLGENQIFLEVYTKSNKSSGGSYRQYVGLEYSHIETLITEEAANINEL